MPDKRYGRGCGRDCIRCWRNRLVHGCEFTPANADDEVVGDIDAQQSKYPKWMDEYELFDSSKPDHRRVRELRKQLIAEYGRSYTDADEAAFVAQQALSKRWKYQENSA